MNKIVYLSHRYFLSEFEETHKWWKDTSIKNPEYTILIRKYYLDNFGIILVNMLDGEEYTIEAKIEDESKFALFMLKYPHHIEKIVYE